MPWRLQGRTVRHTHYVLLLRIVFSCVVSLVVCYPQTTVFPDLGYQPKIVNEGNEGYWRMESSRKRGWRRRRGETFMYFVRSRSKSGGFPRSQCPRHLSLRAPSYGQPGRGLARSAIYLPPSSLKLLGRLPAPLSTEAMNQAGTGQARHLREAKDNIRRAGGVR